MISIAPNNHEKARLRFYAAYVASLILVLAIFSILWNDNAASQPAVTNERTTSASGDLYVKTSAFLHGLLKEQENMYTTALAGDKAVLERLPNALQMAQARLDSVVKHTAVSDARNEAEFRQLYGDVRQLLQSRNKSVQDLLLTKQQANQPAAPVQQNGPAVSAALQNQWNRTVQEKEQQIALLQKQVQEANTEKEKSVSELRNQLAKSRQNTAGANATGGSEWKQKYNLMKTRHGELNNAYNALSRAYQNVVADNRKLYNHIKSQQRQ